MSSRKKDPPSNRMLSSLHSTSARSRFFVKHHVQGTHCAVCRAPGRRTPAPSAQQGTPTTCQRSSDSDTSDRKTTLPQNPVLTPRVRPPQQLDFSVLSYNLLAKKFSHRVPEDASEELRAAFTWENRLALMKKHIQSLGCDFVCMQEVDMPPDFFVSNFSSILVPESAVERVMSRDKDREAGTDEDAKQASHVEEGAGETEKRACEEKEAPLSSGTQAQESTGASGDGGVPGPPAQNGDPALPWNLFTHQWCSLSASVDSQPITSSASSGVAQTATTDGIQTPMDAQSPEGAPIPEKWQTSEDKQTPTQTQTPAVDAPEESSASVQSDTSSSGSQSTDRLDQCRSCPELKKLSQQATRCPRRLTNLCGTCAGRNDGYSVARKDCCNHRVSHKHCAWAQGARFSYLLQCCKRWQKKVNGVSVPNHHPRNAMLYRSDRWDCVELHSRSRTMFAGFRFRDGAYPHWDASVSPAQHAADEPPFRSHFHALNENTKPHVEKLPPPGVFVWLCNVHLEGHPERASCRLNQVRSLFKHLRAHFTNLQSEYVRRRFNEWRHRIHKKPQQQPQQQQQQQSERTAGDVKQDGDQSDDPAPKGAPDLQRQVSEKRVFRAQKRVFRREFQSLYHFQVVMTGDFNDTDTSTVYRALRVGRLPRNCTDFSLGRSGVQVTKKAFQDPLLPLHSAYVDVLGAEPIMSYFSHSGHPVPLDFVLYSRQRPVKPERPVQQASGCGDKRSRRPTTTPCQKGTGAGAGGGKTDKDAPVDWLGRPSAWHQLGCPSEYALTPLKVVPVPIPARSWQPALSHEAIDTSEPSSDQGTGRGASCSPSRGRRSRDPSSSPSGRRQSPRSSAKAKAKARSSRRERKQARQQQLPAHAALCRFVDRSVAVAESLQESGDAKQARLPLPFDFAQALEEDPWKDPAALIRRSVTPRHRYSSGTLNDPGYKTHCSRLFSHLGGGCPNPQFASDHLPVGCVFRMHRITPAEQE